MTNPNKPSDPRDPKPFKPAEPLRPNDPRLTPTQPLKPAEPLKPAPPFKPSEPIKDSEAKAKAAELARVAPVVEPVRKDAKDFIPAPTFNELPEFPEHFKPAAGQDYKWVPKTAADEAKKEGWTPVARHPNNTPDEAWIMVGKAAGGKPK